MVEDQLPEARHQSNIVAILALAMIVSSTMQFSLGVLAPNITNDLQISPAVFGLLPTVLFAVAIVTSVFSSRILNGLGIERSVLAVFVVTAACFGLIMYTRSHVALFFVVGAMGVALAIGNPATNQAIVAYVAPRHHGRAVGVKQAGVQVAALLTGATLPPLADMWGWRAAAQAVTILSIAGLVYTLLFFRGAGLVARDVHKGSSPQPTAHTGALTLGVYGLLMGIGMGATNGFLPLYAHSVLSFDERTAGLLISCVGLLGIVSRYLWGWLGGRLGDPAGALATLAIAAALSEVPIIVSAFGMSWLVWIGAVGLGLTAVAWNSVAMVAVLRHTSREGTARLTGRVMLGFFLGLLTGPAAMGFITTTASYPVGWLTVLACFAAARLVIHRPTTPHPNR
ncbi:MFS transporter [Actinophytocola sp.]|uniref:MFS transporter n=1 Tax=Actinophytocola sp. TaxID=1872138 RepID=UPI003D6A0E46